MAEIIRMPKMSDTMTEGVVAKWHKKVGDSVKSGELMAEIETDKATMDYESFNTGTVLYLGVNEGQAVKVNDVLAIVGNKGEDYSALLAGASNAAASGGKVEEPGGYEQEETGETADDIDGGFIGLARDSGHSISPFISSVVPLPRDEAARRRPRRSVLREERAHPAWWPVRVGRHRRPEPWAASAGRARPA